ncbi:MAG TPA: magnesium/cobalt transporter CorA [bacterium]|nr:magnesium/cobalt transporter CorA [bacterium]
MLKRFRKSSRTVGLPPGTPVYTGEIRKEEKVRITLFKYDESQFQEREVDDIERGFRLSENLTVSWINIDGIHRPEIVQQVAQQFGLHSLTVEDIVNIHQRPKVEEFESYVFVVLKMLYLDEATDQVIAEQISIVLGSGFVLSFQEREGDVFKSIRDRIRGANARIRHKGADYLAYCLIDAVVDHYFTILERMGDDIEKLEEQILSEPSRETLQGIWRSKSEIMFIRRCIWPLREVIGGLQRLESSLVQESTNLFLRDAHDHIIQIIDTVESFRDTLTGMLDTYLSTISNRMNEVMKVLTIIATIFIPLTFIAGVYGMNFKFMPELEWGFGYFAVLIAMGIVALGMVIYFFRKKWF